ncbi:uncharacterized protein FA14DRAFT_77364 [Meira miltonrushii]|uniref:Uncharacterized protein n=1 Tax=Meira miltonrushii TaxID=1280837 RepID=A0A316V6U4_9BASI|nr:uncharacterized protein FA14DRAFT_77364 [Meira miltonrushii]PWN32758.1 hypothetical protein FA14DRAFT_77364 [Meira miltonrushii]
MKSQSIQLIILFVALCALSVHAADKNKQPPRLTEQEKRRLGNRENWEKDQWGKDGYNVRTSSPKGNHQIKGGDHDAGSAYGSGYNSGQGSVGGSSGSHADSSSGSKRSFSFFSRNKN